MKTATVFSLLLCFNMATKLFGSGQELITVEKCYWETFSLSCSTGRSISIVEIVLGETSCVNWRCCPSANDCTQPPSEGHRNSVLRSCNGRANCQVPVAREPISCNGRSEFERIKYNCTDVDECAPSMIARCSSNSVCQNTPGSFTCRCNDGFVNDGIKCIDIDECADSSYRSRCSPRATCANTAGSFNCQCNAGFHGDGFICNDGPDETSSPRSTATSTALAVPETTNMAGMSNTVSLVTSEDRQLTGHTISENITDDGVEHFPVLSAESMSSDSTNDNAPVHYYFLYIGIGAAVGLAFLVVLIVVAVRHYRARRQRFVPDYKSTSHHPCEDAAAVNGSRQHDICERAGLVVSDEDEFASFADVDLQPQVHLRVAGGHEVMPSGTQMEAYYGYEKYEGSVNG